MNALFVLIFTCGGALAIGRGLDLALWTDWNTGLCTAGSVWLRYGSLWAALVVGIIAARKLARQPLVLRSACRPVGITSVLGGVCVGLAGAVRLAVGMTGVGALVRAVLELVCAVWLIRLGRSWTHKGEYRLPGRSMTPAVLGTAVFYWGGLSRFMENSSSWHRVEPTAMVWQMLAALVFLSAMVRALWLPETSNGCQLCEAGICTFLLCFCWELPRVLVLLFHGITAADLPEVLFGFGMCCIGALGLFTVARVAGSDGRPAIPRHAVG